LETIGADPRLVNALDAYRKKRNISGYERAGLISDADAEGMRRLAARLHDDVRAWIRKLHPTLL
jgi:hypothetical protein